MSFVDFEETSLDKNHIWCPGKVHYSKEYYQYSYRKILNIVKYDEINKKINQLNLIDNDLNKEDLIHEISLIEDSNSVNGSVQKRYKSIIDTLKNENIKLKLKKRFH
ncbi:hypothetical protein PXD04_07020 [Methanosphaera sp. ISO3-F5]|uniref:hypothetical protein n=1 Tax=Methanosphaera sp. ISO3-F5 TaxID=1452353 RepID=UPI002B25A25B|nr:hypothetical protein [Methanosphaera sp. ISO3-F5]WQH63455.1 hypothetical protein PXD04_07020 [Methanosphaera sp. ISO3-F5]